MKQEQLGLIHKESESMTDDSVRKMVFTVNCYMCRHRLLSMYVKNVVGTCLFLYVCAHKLCDFVPVCVCVCVCVCSWLFAFSLSPFLSLVLSVFLSRAGTGSAVQGYLEVLLRGEAERVSKKRKAPPPNGLGSPQSPMNSASLHPPHTPFNTLSKDNTC